MSETPTAAQAGDHARRASTVLLDMAEGWAEDRVCLGDVIHALGDRGYGLLFILFAIPNVIPVYVPGLSAVLGIPLAVVALQMVIGLRRPWLPTFLLRRSLARKDFCKLISHAVPYMQRLERMLRPRFSEATGPVAERLAGVVVVIMAILLSLPIPFTNTLFALPIVVMALGLLEKDGIAVAGSLLASVLASVGVVLVGWTAFVAVLAVARDFLGL